MNVLEEIPSTDVETHLVLIRGKSRQWYISRVLKCAMLLFGWGCIRVNNAFDP